MYFWRRLNDLWSFSIGGSRTSFVGYVMTIARIDVLTLVSSGRNCSACINLWTSQWIPQFRESRRHFLFSFLHNVGISFSQCWWYCMSFIRWSICLYKQFKRLIDIIEQRYNYHCKCFVKQLFYIWQISSDSIELEKKLSKWILPCKESSYYHH